MGGCPSQAVRKRCHLRRAQPCLGGRPRSTATAERKVGLGDKTYPSIADVPKSRNQDIVDDVGIKRVRVGVQQHTTVTAHTAPRRWHHDRRALWVLITPMAGCRATLHRTHGRERSDGDRSMLIMDRFDAGHLRMSASEWATGS